MIKEALKKGFSVTKSSMSLVLSLSVVGLVWSILSIQFAPKEATPNTPPSVPFMILGAVVLLASFFIQAGSLGYLFEKIKAGKSSAASFISAGAKYYLRLLGLGLFIGLFGLVFVLLAVAVTAMIKSVGIVVGVALAATWIYVVLLLFLSPYIVVAKDQKLIAAAKESLDLSQKYIWTVVALIGVLIVLGFAIGIGLGFLVGLLNIAIKGQGAEYILAVFSSFINAFLGVLVTASFTAFYLGLPSNSQSHS